MKSTRIYGDFEVAAKIVAPPTVDGTLNIWVDVSVTHAVTGEVVYARVEPYLRIFGGPFWDEQALDAAATETCVFVERRPQGIQEKGGRA